MIKGRKVYDPLTDTWSTGYWVADDKGNYYPVWQEGTVVERLTESNPSWIDDELWERACEPDCEEIDAVYRKLKEYEDLEEQGLLLRLPVEAYFIKDNIVRKGWVQELVYSLCSKLLLDIRYDDSSLDSYRGYLGNDVFLTKSEAEAKLKELRGGENE